MSLSFDLIEHFKYIHCHIFLILCLLVDPDLLKRNLTLTHLTLESDELTLHQKVVLVVFLVQLVSCRFLPVCELVHRDTVLVYDAKIFLLHFLYTAR